MDCILRYVPMCLVPIAASCCILCCMYSYAYLFVYLPCYVCIFWQASFSSLLCLIPSSMYCSFLYFVPLYFLNLGQTFNISPSPGIWFIVLYIVSGWNGLCTFSISCSLLYLVPYLVHFCTFVCILFLSEPCSVSCSLLNLALYLLVSLNLVMYLVPCCTLFCILFLDVFCSFSCCILFLSLKVIG